MHHARQHADTRTRERRHRLAHEAARLMAEGGIRDFHQAKLKAASRLGIHDDASLPRNREIEDALREYQRLFAGPEHGVRLRQRREAALPMPMRRCKCSCTVTMPMQCNDFSKNTVFRPRRARGACAWIANVAASFQCGCSVRKT